MAEDDVLGGGKGLCGVPHVSTAVAASLPPPAAPVPAKASSGPSQAGIAMIRIGSRHYPEAFVFEQDIGEAISCGVTVVRVTPDGRTERVVGLVSDPTTSAR